jgi:molybdopterin-containing oxidoreductase family membrane subunit
MAVLSGKISDHQEKERAELRSEHLMLDPRPRSEMNSMVMEAMRETSWKFWVVTIPLAIFVIVGLFGVWGYLIANGLGVTGDTRPVYWGVFLSNTVFWIGISHTGAFVSALLRVFKTSFHRSITRLAEFMATFGIIQTGLSIFFHLGRPWRFLWLVPIPNQRTIWPDFHSPLMWDFMAINTYMIVSALYLYLPLIPDLAMARDHSTGWRKIFYRIIALGFRGTEGEWAHLRAAIKIFTFVMIPVMVSVTTVVSWDFAMATRPGWSSTVFGPYFVTGAIHSGVAALVIASFIIRSVMKHMKYFIRLEVFDALGKLMLIISMAWAYFFFSDYLVPWYGGNSLDRFLLTFHEQSPLVWLFALMLLGNLVLPCSLLWNKKIRRTPWMMFIISLFVIVGMWIERFLIVPGSLTVTTDPFTWRVYQISWVEISLSLGTLAFFLLLYLVASRFVPVISTWEVQEGQMEYSIRQVGKMTSMGKTDLD